MDSPSHSIRWTAFLRWLLYTAVALIIGMAVFILIGSIAGEALDSGPTFLFGTVLGAIFGTAFGIGQWLFLKRYLPSMTAWIPATILAFIASASIIFGLLDGAAPESSIITRLSHAVILGFLLGLGQWLVLRAKPVYSAYLWILFSLAGWIIGELAGIVASSLSEPPLDLFALFLAGASLPGIGMVWLLKSSSLAGTA